MPDTTTSSSPSSPYLTQKMQDNPIATAIVSLILVVATTIATAIGTSKGVAANEVKEVAPIAVRVAGENIFATKSEKDEIWRYLGDRRGQRDKDFDKIEKNMVTKAEFQMLMDAVKDLSRKLDEHPPVYRSQ